MATLVPGPRKHQGHGDRKRPNGSVELYSPGAVFTWPELQAMAADGVLSQLYATGYISPGTATTPAAAGPRSRLRRPGRESGSGSWPAG